MRSPLHLVSMLTFLHKINATTIPRDQVMQAGARFEPRALHYLSLISITLCAVFINVDFTATAFQNASKVPM